MAIIYMEYKIPYKTTKENMPLNFVHINWSSTNLRLTFTLLKYIKSNVHIDLTTFSF